jgi:hypothetical protein
MAGAVVTSELPAGMAAAIRETKARLREQAGDVTVAFARAQEAMRAEVEAVLSPHTEKNAAYAAACGQAFLADASPADFAAEDYERAWTGRATLADLTPTGRQQLGLAPA